MVAPKLFRTMAILAILVLSVLILFYARPFLVPGAFALLLSLLLLPLARWLQAKGAGRGLAAFAAVFVLVLALGLILFFVFWQFSNLMDDTAKMEQQLSEKFRQVQLFISQKLGISAEKQKEMMQQQQSTSGGKLSGMILGLLSGAGGFLTSLVLVLVYVFMMLYLRSRLRQFLLRLVPVVERDTAQTVLHDIQKVSQKYLTGLALMIGSLWVMYGIGFSIVGVKNAIFFAILCGLLEIVPFVGNIAGTLLTMGMALVQGEAGLIVGIAITYASVQFIQTYILEPLVVGSEVNLNPLFTIAGIVAGEQIWGIPGMILAVPLLGMAKIVCDHVEPLKPYGYLIGGEPQKESSIKKKIRSLFKKS
ncbi:MAG: AI-2E family transporter [Chitinophagaceae bacterium]|nr:MAG: AI-2E family transporter [Chitinophagaceae bacterium]